MSTVTETPRNTSYGDYILRTGQGIIGQYELVFGAFLYQKFAGRKLVVDIGPGRCWFPKQNPQAIVAVDNSPELVEHYSRQGIDIRLGDAYSLGLPDEYADGVFSCWLFEHLGDPLAAMKEIRRVMQPGAFGMIIVPTPHDMMKFYDDYTHVTAFTPNSLKQLAQDAGFNQHREYFLNFSRGSMQMLKYFGRTMTLGYLNFSDRYLRKVGMLNRDHAVVEFWK